MDYSNTFDQTREELIEAMARQYQLTVDYLLKACFIESNTPLDCTCKFVSVDRGTSIDAHGCLIHDPTPHLDDCFIYHDEQIEYVDDNTIRLRQLPTAPKYPNECPCGIAAAVCEYHKEC